MQDANLLHLSVAEFNAAVRTDWCSTMTCYFLNADVFTALFKRLGSEERGSSGVSVGRR